MQLLNDLLDHLPTPEDGVLSAVEEWHALTVGIAAGILGRGDEVFDLVLGERVPATPAEMDIRDQGWYAATGVVLAMALRWIVRRYRGDGR